MSHATNSHATDSHAKHMYITHIYTQPNREKYLARITCSITIMIIYNQENQTCQDKRDKQQEECTCQGEQSDHTTRRVNM